MIEIRTRFHISQVLCRRRNPLPAAAQLPAIGVAMRNRRCLPYAGGGLEAASLRVYASVSPLLPTHVPGRSSPSVPGIRTMERQSPV